MINDEERKRAVAELREASTGAYRHVDSLDVIANSIGVEVDGNEALVPVLRGVRREARALCKRLDPKWRRARIRALKRSRRNVETLKREGRCR